METPKSQIESPMESPLAVLHGAAGANMGVWFGCTLPDDWGNPQEEQRYANETVALIDKNYRTHFSFHGPDRVRYLNAVLTNNIKGLAAGQGIVSLMLNAQGRILAEMETFADAEKIFCVSYQIIRQRLVELFDKYIIMDDVTLTDESERFSTLALEGPRTAKVVNELTGSDLSVLSPLGWAEANVKSPIPGSSIPCRLIKRAGGSVTAAEFIVQREYLEPLWNILLTAAHQHDGGPMGYKALSAQRLVQGTPWFGYDFGEKQIPHEAALELSHISYTKGCYTGQEIVERVRSRGQVNRRRVELLISGEGVPENGADLFLDSKPVGFVTRAAKSWFPPCTLGMGYVVKESRALGTVLNWAGGTATVVEVKETLGSGVLDGHGN